MSDESPADHVPYQPAPAPPAPNPDYLPSPGEARDRAYASHANRMAEWSGYLQNYNRAYKARKEQTSNMIASRRAARRSR